jgi:hypothetical protein
MGSRFYQLEVTDLWMSDSESSPSKRTADGKAANYLFTGLAGRARYRQE